MLTIILTVYLLRECYNQGKGGRQKREDPVACTEKPTAAGFQRLVFRKISIMKEKFLNLSSTKRKSNLQIAKKSPENRRIFEIDRRIAGEKRNFGIKSRKFRVKV